MQFLTVTDWEFIRIDIRPKFAGGGGLNFDDVELRYRPNAPFTETKVCISPSFDEAPTPPETELVLTDESVEVALSATPTCQSLDWTNTDNWNGYLPTSEVQFVFDPFRLTVSMMRTVMAWRIRCMMQLRMTDTDMPCPYCVKPSLPC